MAIYLEAGRLVLGGETDKSLNTTSAELCKTGEGNHSKNHHHGTHIHMHVYACAPVKCFSHEFSLTLKASKNISDVIYQWRHNHFRK